MRLVARIIEDGVLWATCFVKMAILDRDVHDDL